MLGSCSRPLIEIPTGTFYGTLPCADCPGIRYELTLKGDNTYRERRQYVGKSTTVLVDSGTYMVEQDTVLRLGNPSDEGMNRWTVTNGTLRMLDQSGALIENDFAERYVLSPEKPDESSTKTQSNIDFKATGNEPFWVLEIDFTQKMRFKTLNGLELITPVPETTYPQENVIEWKAATKQGELLVTVTREKCQDTMSGDTSSYQVRMRATTGDTETQTYAGCGRYLVNYRLNNRWLLSSINEQPTNAGVESPHLEFQLADNRVSGFGGCNRFTGSIKLTDDTVEFGSLASTKMACPTLIDETAFLKSISERQLSFRLEEQQLILSNDSTTLMFRAAD